MYRDVIAAILGTNPLTSGPPPGSPEGVALCGLSPDDFHGLLMDLLPLGAAWPRIENTVLWNFWFVPADVYAAVQANDCHLLDESYPCGAVDLLPEWAATAGLPDECILPYWPVDTASQQLLVCAKLAARGGQSRAYFIALAAAYGFTITITEHPPWRLGLDELCPPSSGHISATAIGPVGQCEFWWEVNVEGNTGPFDPAVLECLIQRAAPAHTTVTFNWDYLAMTITTITPSATFPTAAPGHGSGYPSVLHGTFPATEPAAQAGWHLDDGSQWWMRGGPCFAWTATTAEITVANEGVPAGPHELHLTLYDSSRTQVLAD